MLVPTKKWYTSKLFWLGVLQVALGILELVRDGLASGEGWLSMGLGALTVVLRYVTTQPITFRDKPAKVVEP